MLRVVWKCVDQSPDWAVAVRTDLARELERRGWQLAPTVRAPHISHGRKAFRHPVPGLVQDRPFDFDSKRSATFTGRFRLRKEDRRIIYVPDVERVENPEVRPRSTSVPHE